MNYTELLFDTFDYSSTKNEQNDSILKFRVRLVGVLPPISSSLNISRLNLCLENWDDRTLNWNDVIEVGELLGNALFQSDIREILLKNLPKKGAEDGLRIRLFLDYPLTNYPFEYMLINDTGGESTSNHFIALNPNVSIVRQQTNQAVPGRLSQAKLPVKLIIALANPYNDLDLSKEKAAIENAVKQYPDRIDLVSCNHVTKDILEKAMVEAPIFHFAGHAKMDIKASKDYPLIQGKGKLILHDKKDLPVDDLSILLKNANTSIAILGGCDTARRDDINVWSNLASNLLNAGLFAVVAMQYKISNDSATAFARGFYNTLVAGLPIDQAVTYGRIAVRAHGNIHDWAVPVLYLAGTTDGVIFEGLKNDINLDSLRDEIRKNVFLVSNNFSDTRITTKVMNIWGGKIKLVSPGVVGVVEGDYFDSRQMGWSLNDIENFIKIIKDIMPGVKPEVLGKTLLQFRTFHSMLKEWKQLHNKLHEIINVFCPFYNWVLSVDKTNIEISFTQTCNLWRPVPYKINLLLEFAGDIRIIGKPFKKKRDNSLFGERWAIDIYNVSNDIKRYLDEISKKQLKKYPNPEDKQNNMYDSWKHLDENTKSFWDAAFAYLDRADSHLHETASELSQLSDEVFGSLRT